MSNINDLAEIEAFVYCWTDHLTNKLYVGSHKGSPEDGYVCSSKWMMEEYRIRPQDFTRQIIAEGTLDDIRVLETKILQAENAAVNENYYNKHMNNGFYFAGWTTETITDEHRKNMSIAQKGLKKTQKHLDALHEGRRNSTNSKEHRESLSKALKGNDHGKGNKGKIRTPEMIKKNSESHKGKIASPETRALLSLRTKEYWVRKKEDKI